MGTLLPNAFVGESVTTVSMLLYYCCCYCCSYYYLDGSLDYCIPPGHCAEDG